MATFAKLTKIDSDGQQSAEWINLDLVTNLTHYRFLGQTRVCFVGEGYFNVTETPEHIAHLAYTEHPAVADGAATRP